MVSTFTHANTLIDCARSGEQPREIKAHVILARKRGYKFVLRWRDGEVFLQCRNGGGVEVATWPDMSGAIYTAINAALGKNCAVARDRNARRMEVQA